MLNACYLIFQYGDKRRVKIAPSLWPSDTSGTRYGVPCTVGQLRLVSNSSDAPAREWRGSLDSENRDGTARETSSSGAWWRVCRPDDDGEDVKHGEAADADEEPSNGRRGYTIQWWWQGNRDKYAAIGWKAQLHRSVVVAVAASTNTSPLDGRRSSAPAPSSGCGGGSSSHREYLTSSGRCTVSRRLPWSPRPGR